MGITVVYDNAQGDETMMYVLRGILALAMLCCMAASVWWFSQLPAKNTTEGFMALVAGVGLMWIAWDIFTTLRDAQTSTKLNSLDSGSKE